MRVALLSCLLIVLMVSGCLEEDLMPKPFFGTEEFSLSVSEERIGSYILQATITDLSAEEIADNCNQLFEYGFYFHPDRSLVVSRRPEARYVVSTPLVNQTFSLPAPPTEPNVWYYFQPFTTCNERNVTSSQLDSFRVDLNVSILPQDQPRRNDTLFYQLDLERNRFVPNNATTGYVLLAANGQDTVAGPVEVAENDRGDFYIVFPTFNSTYLLRPYLFDGVSYFFGADLPVVLTDGWIRIADLPGSVHEAEAVALGDRIFVFGGCIINDCRSPARNNRPIYILEQDQNNPPDSLSWLTEDVGETEFNYRAEGVAFNFAENIWHILGSVPPLFGPNNLPRLVNNGNFYTPNGTTSNGSSIGIRRRGAVAFTQEGRVFFGSGDDNSSVPRDEFYEFQPDEFGDPVTPLPAVNSLPLGGPDGIETGGRAEAVAVGTNNGTLVGTGQSSGSLRGDFFRFSTPSPGRPLGAWDQVASLPVARRAAAAFSIEGRAFVGLGRGELQRYFRDLYEFIDDGNSGTWVAREPFPGLERGGATAFSFNGYGCICGGIGNDPNDNSQPIYKDCWLYEPTAE